MPGDVKYDPRRLELRRLLAKCVHVRQPTEALGEMIAERSSGTSRQLIGMRSFLLPLGSYLCQISTA